MDLSFKLPDRLWGNELSRRLHLSVLPRPLGPAHCLQLCRAGLQSPGERLALEAALVQLISAALQPTAQLGRLRLRLGERRRQTTHLLPLHLQLPLVVAD